MVTIIYFTMSVTLVAFIALVDVLLRKQSIQLELLSVFSKNENMNIIYYLFFWVFGLLWGGVTDYRFWKAKRSKQS